MRWIAPVVVPCFYFIVQLLPETLLLRLAPTVGKILRIGMKERIIRNMQCTLGHARWKREQWVKRWEDHAAHIGLTVIEPFQLRKMNNDQLRSLISLEGEDYLRGALACGRGVMVFVNHLGNLGCIAAGLGLRGYDVSIAGNALPVQYIERKAQSLIRSVGGNRLLIGEQLPFRASEVFRRNGIFATFIDFSILKKRNVWIPFGQGEMSVNLGPALIALRHRVPVLCITSVRLNSNRHTLTIHPPLDYALTEDLMHEAVLLTKQAIARFADDLCSYPEQWWQWYTNRIREKQESVVMRRVNLTEAMMS
ncbi:MAG: lipid biosynthesis acyltransferase [Bacteroidetes bacterium]|nr:lipid biosynthesis acyltransferase [Bacteroidota bacterium]